MRGLVLLAGATLAQHRPWNRLGERLGVPATNLPKPVVDAIDTAKQIVDSVIPSNAETPAVGAGQDNHGCMLGGGYTWCEEKNKCLRVWEEPCKAVDTPVCASDEVICTTELQQQGMNCVVGTCVKTPVSAPVCASDEVVCTTELQKQGMNCAVGKCVKAPVSTPVCASDEVVCTTALQRQGMNCVLGSCAKVATTQSQAGSIRAMGGKTDSHGCILGTGFSWCEVKKKCLRQWEEPCEASTNVPVCASGEVVCTTLLQKQGMNCALGKCFAVPSSKPQPFGRTRDVHGCVTGGGYQWCESKKKCTRQWEEACEEVAPEPQPVGGSQDNHGCLGGAGYQWCEGKQKCLRIWEEACEEAPQPVGGTTDNHGCVSGGGYQWCEGKQKCLRSWEEACEEAPKPVGGAQDNHGCVLGGGYQWCENKQKCLRSWEEPCEEELTPVGGTKDNHGCASGGGYQWCESKQKCLRSWEEACEQEQEQEQEPASLPALIHNMLTPEQKSEMNDFMTEVRAKQAIYMGELKQKMTEFHQEKAFDQMSNSVRQRMQRVTSLLRPKNRPGFREDNTRADSIPKDNTVVDGAF